MKKEEYPVDRLSRRKFADALQKGLGRAYLYAIKYGIDEVANLVLGACLHDQAYDPQSEPSKAEYLFAMFRETKYLPRFKEAILNALKTKRSTWDVQLLFELALKMAKAGDHDSREGIRSKALKKAKKSGDDWLGASELITIYGIEGAMELARTYGSRLLKDPEDFVPQDEIFHNEEIKSALRKRLLKDSRIEPSLKAYWNYLDKKGVFKRRSHPPVDSETRDKRRKQALRQRYKLNSILSDAKNKIETLGMRFSLFGWAATQEELEVAFKYLLNETDNAIIWRLLSIFNEVPLPNLDDKLFLWAHSQDNEVRGSAICTLAQNSDEKVRSLALEKLQTTKLIGPDSYSIRLFLNNYTPDDARLITYALHKTRPVKEDAHSLSWDVIDLSKKYHDVGLADALNWSYEKTPCSACRRRIVEQLDSLGRFEGAILYECRFDGNKDIADMAKTKTVSLDK